MPVDSGGVVPELASPGDVPALAVTVAAAFGDDAMIRWPMPGASAATLAELFRVILAPYAESGVLWKIGGCDGGPRGCRRGWPGGSPRSSSPPGLPSAR